MEINDLSEWLKSDTKNLIRFETSMFIIIGLLTIFFPEKMLMGFNYVFAVACLAFGIISLNFAAKSTSAETPATNWVPFVTSMTMVSLGVVLFIDGVLFIRVFLGVWLFTFGIFQILRVIAQHKTLSYWGLTLFVGVAATFFAINFWFDWPLPGVKNAGYFIGPTLIITGITIWYNNRNVFVDAAKKTKTTKKSS